MDSQLDEFLIHRNIKAFISSTFQDLDEERTFLVKYIFPRIVDYCKARYISFRSIDLRWGITAEQNVEKEIIKVCFDEIDYSSPFFIGIVGGRYGWIPQAVDFGNKLNDMCRRAPWLRKAIQQGKSITEIEFLYGALMRTKDIAACFYLKDGIQVESAAAEFRARIKEQKKIPVRLYTTVEQFGEMVYNDIVNRIDYLFSTIDNDRFLQQKMRHEYALQQRINHIIAFPETTMRILNQWHDSKSNAPLIITEERFIRDGITRYKAPGKSTLLCYYTALMRKHGINVIYYDIQEYYDSHISCFEDIVNYINQTLAKIDSGNEIIIAIDNFDFVMNKEYCGLWTKTLLELQSKGRVIVTSRGSALAYKIDMEVKNCPDFSKDEKSKIIDIHTEQYGKKLASYQKEKILDSRFGSNLNELIYLLNTLIGFGSYEDLDKMIESCCNCDHCIDFLVRDITENVGNIRNNQWEALWILNEITLTGAGGLTEQEIIDLSEIAGIEQLKWAKIRNRILQLCHKIGNAYTLYDQKGLVETILRDYFFTNYRDLANEQMREYFAKHKVHTWRYAQIIPALYTKYIGADDKDKWKKFESEFPSVFMDVELVNNMSTHFLYWAWSRFVHNVGYELSMKDAPMSWVLREDSPTYSVEDMENYYSIMASICKDLDRYEDYEICMRRLQQIWDDDFKKVSAEIDILLFKGLINEAYKLCNSCDFSYAQQTELRVKVLRTAFETSDDIVLSNLPSIYDTLSKIWDNIEYGTDLFYDVLQLSLDVDLFLLVISHKPDEIKIELEKRKELISILEECVKDLAKHTWREKRIAEIYRLMGYISMLRGEYQTNGMCHLDYRTQNEWILHGKDSIQYKRAMLEYGLSFLMVKEPKLGNEHIKDFFEKKNFRPDFRLSQLCNPWLIFALYYTNALDNVYPTYREKAYLKLQDIHKYMVNDKNNSHAAMLFLLSNMGYKFHVPLKIKLKWPSLFFKLILF